MECSSWWLDWGSKKPNYCDGARPISLPHSGGENLVNSEIRNERLQELRGVNLICCYSIYLSLSLCPNLQDAVSPPLLSTASHKFDISMKWLKDTEDRITKWWNRNSYFQLKNWFQRVELFISYNNTNNHISQLDQTYLSHWKRFRFESHQMWYKGAQPCPCNGITIHTITPNK